MNARRLLAAVTLLATAWHTEPDPALSSDLPYYFVDPLSTVPDVVKKGATLPGDSAPFPRSVKKDFSKPLVLSEAVDLALSNNQVAKGAWADIKVQAGALGEARALYLPTVIGSAGYTKDYQVYTNSTINSNQLTSQLSASLQLFDFGGRSANRKANELLLASALSSYDATIQDVLSRVIQSYFDAMTSSASVAAKSKDEEVARETLRSAQDRQAKGAVSQSDTLRATTALARASLDKSRAEGENQKALAVLKYHLGVTGNTELRLPMDLTEYHAKVEERKKLSHWLEEAQKGHPAIVSARKQLEASEEQVTVSKSSGLPVVSFSANYYLNNRPGAAVNPGSTETTMYITATLPIFDGFASTYKVRGAQARVEKRVAALADTEQQVAVGVIRAYADTSSALQNLDASATLLASAQSSLTVSQRKYNKGAADITEVLSTQAALADALNERVRCLSEWNSARLHLLASAGRMGRFATTD